MTQPALRGVLRRYGSAGNCPRHCPASGPSNPSGLETSMRMLVVVAVLMASCPTARAQDGGDCDKITLASKDGSIQRYSNVDIDRGLCTVSKLVWQAAIGANKTQDERCAPAMSAVLRELTRRKRDPQQVRAKCSS